MKKKEVYNHKPVEAKWREVWEQNQTFSPNISGAKKPFYNLMMFPYPSAEGLHVGNMYAFTGADVYGRYMRMKGWDVFEPIGLDGFGIHSENYAIKVGRHPKEHAQISEKHYYEQLHQIGDSYDWRRTLETYDPDYYKWTQWLFVKMFKAGLAYKGQAQVNWCPSCKTVLADEQVVTPAQAGKDPKDNNGNTINKSLAGYADLRVCERCATAVSRREMSSWFFKITSYADRLLTNIDKIKWPEKIKTAQRQWIGKSKGLSIEFKLNDSKLCIKVWTKFWETVFGTTFIVVAPEFADENLVSLLPQNYAKDVKEYIKVSLNKSEQERKETKEKTGVYMGMEAINPVNGMSVPIYVADYVLANVGTGAVMGVPAHDERDFAFAKKYDLDIVQVVSYADSAINKKVASKEIPFEGEGLLMNSGQFDGLAAWGEGKEQMALWMIKEGFASWETNYHLRDWLISRQRYWGPPIPMIYCDKCSWQAVPEKDLPVILPDIKDFKPKGDGTSPLHNAPDSWKKVACPNCGAPATRELDVSDTFLDSAWYFLAYPNLESNAWKGVDSPLDSQITKRWLPVSAYIGGAEHAVLHLLYARFVWMFLLDEGYLKIDKANDEPFPFLFSHGLIIKDGAKMSKSRGNIVNPDEYIEKFGADTLRTYLMFLGPYDEGGDFRDTGIEGMQRFIRRLWSVFVSLDDKAKEDNDLTVKMHQTIQKVDRDLSAFKYNTAISAIMEYVNVIKEKELYSPVYLEALVKLIAPFAPHIAEEVYQKYFAKGKGFASVHFAKWPEPDAKYLKEDRVTIVVQVNGKVRSSFSVDVSLGRADVLQKAMKDQKVAKWLGEKKIVKEIFVPGKLVSFVTG